jgi:hypothetical protein
MRVFTSWIAAVVVITPCFANDPADPAFPFDLSLKANPDSAGVRLQWSAQPRAQELRPGVTGEFFRPSPAARATPDGEIFVPPNVPLTEPVLGVSASNGEYWNEDVSGRASIVPAFVKDGLLYGTSLSSRIYTSTNGRDWTPHGTATGNQLILLKSGAVLKVDTSQEQVRVFRSTDNALSFQQCVTEEDGTPFHWITPGAFLSPFGFHQAENGTIVMAEYRLPEGARYLYRSGDDGLSWKAVFDGYASGREMSHFHAVSKHEGLQRWVAATGDAIDRQRYVVSDDDGLTWREYFDMPGQIYSQPTYLMNYGHPTRFLFGSDLAYQIGWVDVSDGPEARQIQSRVFNFDGRPGKNYCFFMWKHDGVYYATSTDTSRTERNPVIIASRDAATWSIYHRLENIDNGAIAFAGYLAGRMHVVVSSSGNRRHLALAPVETADRVATYISNASSNLADAAVANASTTEGWYVTDPQYFSVSKDAHTGDTCLHYRRSDPTNVYLISPPISVQPGEIIQARFWVRGVAGSCVTRWSVNYGDAGEAVLFGASPQAWQEIVTRPLTVPANAQVVRLLLLLSPDYGTGMDIRLDTISIERVSASQWQPPDFSRSAERWIERRPVDSAWTDIFTIRPRVIRDALPQYGSPMRLKSYRLVDDDGNTAASLDLMYQTVGGVRATYIDGNGMARIQVLPASFFQRDAQLRLVVGQDWTGITVGISDGRPLRTMQIKTPTRLTHGELVMEVGEDETASTLSATWLDNLFYDYSVADDRLADAVRPAELASRTSLTEFVVERRTGLGPYELIATVPASQTEFVDTSAPAAEPVAYRVRAARSGELATKGPVAMVNPGPDIDFNSDGKIDLRDHAALMSSYGRCIGSPMYLPRCDLDGDGCVGPADLEHYFVLFSLIEL